LAHLQRFTIRLYEPSQENILNYVLVILVVRNIFIKYLNFREFSSTVGEFND